MPDAVWHFCRSCGYRGQFVAEADEPVRCPKCHERHVESIMRRQDVAWLKIEGKMPGKEEGIE